MSKRKRRIARHVALVALSIVIAIALAETGLIHRFLEATQDYELLNAFFAGMFFVSIFTAVPAGVVLVDLAHTMPPMLLAAAGGFGNLCGDALLFYIFRTRIEPDGETLIKHSPFKRIYRALQRNAFLHWSAIFLGAIIAASPLPDELGIALMGSSKISRPMFLLLLLPLDFVCILLIALAGRTL